MHASHVTYISSAQVYMDPWCVWFVSLPTIGNVNSDVLLTKKIVWDHASVLFSSIFWICGTKRVVDNFIAAGDAALHEDLPEEAWQLDHTHVFSLFVAETLYHKNIWCILASPFWEYLASLPRVPEKHQTNHHFLAMDPGKSSILQAHPTFVTKAKICRRTSVPFKSCVVKSYLGCSFAAVNVVVFLADGHDGAWLRRRRSVLWVPHIRWGYWMCNGSGVVIEIDIGPLFRILGRETRFKLHSYIPHHSNQWRFSMLRFQCFVLFFDCNALSFKETH